MKRFYWLLFALTVPTFCIAQTPFRLWGVADRGPNGNGTIFRLNPDGSGFTNVKNFAANADGSNPHYPMVEAPDGKVYGTTPNGGATNDGVLFRINADGTSYTKIYDFNFSTGSFPSGTLFATADGHLIGVARLLENGLGTVFKIKTDGTGYQQLANFTQATGFYSVSGLIKAADGLLYGTTT